MNIEAKVKQTLKERCKKIEIAKYADSFQEQIYIAITRFNNETWRENKDYRIKNHLSGCLYGSPNEITRSIPHGAPVYVLEMNNSTNEIMGIGKITNAFNPETHKKHVYKIYSDGNYSRFVYYGRKRIDKADFNVELNRICHLIEWFVFKGYGPLDKPRRGTHMKRGMGIQRLPAPLLKQYNGKMIHLDKQIRHYFELYFRRK